MKPRHWIALVFLFLFGSCTYGFLLGLRTDVYHGRVVDAATGAPLAGAAVTVVWSKVPPITQGEGPSFFLNAQETVTDADGRFLLQVSPGLNWDPTTVTKVRLGDDPQIVIFSPGYEPLCWGTMQDVGFKDSDVLIAALKRGATVKLRQLSKEEIRHSQYLDHGAVVVTLDMPLRRIPILIGAINTQRKMAGFDTYVETPQKEKRQ